MRDVREAAQRTVSGRSWRLEPLVVLRYPDETMRVYEHPYRPVPLDASITKDFPLNSMAEQLMEEATAASTGRASLTLAHGDDLTVVLTAMTAGTALHEHRAPSSATVVTLNGSIVFSASTENIRLEQGEAVVFTADVLHTVEANEDSVFLIVIGGKS